MKLGITFATCAAIFAAMPASAAVTIENFKFSVSGFEPRAPFQTIEGAFSRAFDDVTNVYWLEDISIIIGEFEHNMSNSSIFYNTSYLEAYGNTGDRGISAGTDDFRFRIGNDNSIWMSYTNKSSTWIHLPLTTATYTLERIQSAVPEPATWLMIILGFGAVGGAMRHRRAISVSPSLS